MLYHEKKNSVHLVKIENSRKENFMFFDVDDNNMALKARVSQVKRMLTVEEWDNIINMNISYNSKDITAAIKCLTKLRDEGVFGDDFLYEDITDDELMDRVAKRFNVDRESLTLSRFTYKGSMIKLPPVILFPDSNRISSGFMIKSENFVMIYTYGSIVPYIYDTNDISRIVRDLSDHGYKQDAIATILDIAQSTVSNYVKESNDGKAKSLEAINKLKSFGK